MNSNDFITILGNLSQSLYPVQKLITGGAYLLGILFFVNAIGKLRKIADHRAQSSSNEKMLPAMFNLFMGAALIYLPSALDVMANTAFGVNNVLTYTSTANSKTVTSIMGVMIRTAGILWFIRGCVLVVHSSAPGNEDGAKGLAFIGAGILAMNFDNTIAMVNSLLDHIVTLTLHIKNTQGY